MRRLLIAGTVLLSLCSGAALGELVPVPRQKPERLGATPVLAVPIPRPNPRRLPQAGNQAAKPWPGEGSGWPLEEVKAQRALCKQLLEGADVAYEPLEPIGRSGGCGTPAPIALSAVAGIALKPPAIVNCDMALSLHQWVTRHVQPTARRKLKTDVTEIHVAASYVCRRRNNAASGKLSEHGRANAIDMSGFSFARKESVAVGGGGWGEGLLSSIGLSKDGSFLSSIRKGACDEFTTVLGPGSDPYHGDHFHVDVLQRKGGYRICK